MPLFTKFHPRVQSRRAPDCRILAGERYLEAGTRQGVKVCVGNEPRRIATFYQASTLGMLFKLNDGWVSGDMDLFD